MTPLFYTNVYRNKSEIIHRYIDADGIPHIEKVTDFKLKLFSPTTRKASIPARGFYGESLETYEFNNIREFSDFNYKNSKMMKIYGMDNPIYQFINGIYSATINMQFQHIKICNFDIETKVGDDFPDPSLAEQEITAITVMMIGSKDTVTWTTLDYVESEDEEASEHNTVHVVDNESQLLLSFLDWFAEEKPNALTGWNIETFDIPYIINRGYKTIGSQIELFSPLRDYVSKPLKIGTKLLPNMDKEVEVYTIAGIDILDYMEMYNKFSFEKLPNKKLETVLQHELKIGKVDYSGLTFRQFYEQQPTKFVRYNIIDVVRVNELDEKLSFIMLAYTLAYEAKVNPVDVFKQTRFWDVFIYNFLDELGIQIPPRSTQEKAEVQGAFVREVKAGRHKWVISFDLTSLYPMCICQYNISPEMMRGRNLKRANLLESLIAQAYTPELEKAKSLDFSMAANGCYYEKTEKGIFPQVVDILFTKRKTFKKEMLKLEQVLEDFQATNQDVKEHHKRVFELESQIATLDAKQMAMKIAINSLYGATGAYGFRYYDPDMAESITYSGQLASRYIGNKVNEYLNKMAGTTDHDFIIAGDTDSIYVCIDVIIDKYCGDKNLSKEQIIDFMDNVCKHKIEKFIERSYEELAVFMNAFENKMSMKREVLADEAIWRAKKNYVISVYDNEGVRYSEPHIKMVGIETAKGGTPTIVKRGLNDLIKIMLHGTESELIDYVEQFEKDFMSADLADICKTIGVNGVEKYYGDDFEIRLSAPKNKHGKVSPPYNVKASNAFNRQREQCKYYETPPIQSGDKVKLVMLKKQNPFSDGDYFAFHDEIPEQFGVTEYIDLWTQYETVFVKPLRSFTDIIGWKHQRMHTMDDFFI